MATWADLDAFKEIWLHDFEFTAPDGEHPKVICLVAREFRSGRVIRLGEDELRRRKLPPYPIGRDSLLVSYSAGAELSCHLALGWPLPERILDLCQEFRWIINGLFLKHGAKLLDAMMFFGLDVMDAAEKSDMQDLAKRGGPFTSEERAALLVYCERDVAALDKLLPRMLPHLDIPHAVALRGRYMRAVTRMEWEGVPIDCAMLDVLRAGWEDVKDKLIEQVDSRFGVFDGRTFKADRWADWLTRNGIPWPRTETGRLALDTETFREMARAYPEVSLMHELRTSLSKLRLNDLIVGSDSRNRTWLAPFVAKTSRNAPSTSKFIFGPSTWIRGLIKPEPGQAIAYVDWCQQEFGIAAALSGDDAMIKTYLSDDPYTEFGRRCGLIPEDGTRHTHKVERDRCKACVLGVQYGLGYKGLADRIGLPHPYGRELLQAHRRTYPKFWAWSDGAETHLAYLGWIQTVFGWKLRKGPGATVRTARNFPCQANGAELLRLACSLATERGIPVLAPVHDAIMIGGPVRQIDKLVAKTQQAMADASTTILNGFKLRSDAYVVRWPDRYMDDRGRNFWTQVVALLGDQACATLPCT